MRDHSMKLDGERTLGYSDYGEPSGIPIFLFHGTPGSRLFGLEGDPLLERYGIRVIAPERPGYGLSDPKPNGELADWAADVAALADHLGIDRFHVAGESGGGPYVVACAIGLPTRILSATLIGSVTPPETFLPPKGRAVGARFVLGLVKYAPFVLKLLLAVEIRAMSKNPGAAMQRMLKSFSDWDRRVLNDSNGKARKNVLLLHFREAFRQGSDGVYRDLLLMSQSWKLDLSRVEVPVFLWHGELDTLVPIEPVKEFAKLIPHCESHFLPEAGHLLLESDDVASRIVARLLSVQARHAGNSRPFAVADPG